MISSIISHFEDRQAWLKARKNGIGASDCAAICRKFDGQDDGREPWKTPYTVYADKRGLLPPQEETERMEWGNRLEPVIREKFREVHGEVVYHPYAIHHHPEQPWLMASLDGIWRDAVLEIKSAASSRGWGHPDVDNVVPQQYYYQVQHQMLVTGLDRVFIAVLFGGSRYLEYEIARDEAVLDDIWRECWHFWHDNVLAGVAPDVVTVGDAKAVWPNSNGKVLNISKEEADVIFDWREQKKVLARAEGEKAALEVAVRQIIGEYDAVVFNGSTIATNRSDKNGRRILR